MNRLARSATAVFIAAIVVLASGCATTPTAKLDGSSWRLSAWSISSQRASDFAITARFADGRIAGRSGVNSYGGSATVGPGSALAIGPLAATKMAGPEPAMRAERAYLDLLAGVASYRLAGDGLALLDADGNERLVFERERP